MFLFTSNRCWKDIIQQKAVCCLDALIWIHLEEHVPRHLRVMCVCQLKHSHRSSFMLLLWPHVQKTMWKGIVQLMYFTTSFACSPTINISSTSFARLSVQWPCCLLRTVDFQWNWGCIQLEASVSSDLDLFYSWQGGRCVLRCVNRLANCACPLTETVIACVLEYFAWRTGGSALEPVLFWWGGFEHLKNLLHLGLVQWRHWRVCQWHNTCLQKWPSWQLDLHVI